MRYSLNEVAEKYKFDLDYIKSVSSEMHRDFKQKIYGYIMARINNKNIKTISKNNIKRLKKIKKTNLKNKIKLNTIYNNIKIECGYIENEYPEDIYDDPETISDRIESGCVTYNLDHCFDKVKLDNN